MKKSSFFIAGRHAVTEALKNPNRKVLRVFLNEDSKKKMNRNNQTYNLFKDVKIYYKTKKELDNYCSKDQLTHQGCVAEIEHLEMLSLKDFINQNSNKKNINLVILEEVTDARNIGSIIRSAASFNINGIIIKERSFPSESKLMYKSASGCMELINFFEVSNISSTIKYLKTKNFWISGFDLSSKNDFTKNNWTGNNVLLFGSEGTGLNYQTKKNCDYLLRIKMNKNVESLNISNSASVVFHYLNLISKKNVE